MKKLLLSLFCLVAASLAAQAEDVTVPFDFVNNAYEMVRRSGNSQEYNINPTTIQDKGVKIVFNDANNRLWTDGMRFYKNSTFTVSAEGYKVVKVELNSEASNISYVNGNSNVTLSNNTWTGSEDSAKFICTISKSSQTVKTITVTISPKEVDKRDEAGLAFEESLYNANIGENFDNPKLINPNNRPVVWDSSNKSVATVDKDGNVTLEGAGETVISVTSEESETYKPGYAAYTLSVKDPNSKYVLVTDVAQLGESAQIIIANTANKKALGAQADNNNNRRTADITFADDGAISTYGEAQIITLTKKNGKYSLSVGKDENGKELYLFAAGSKTSGNYLRAQNTETFATITISGENSDADITFDGEAKSRILRYNSSNNPPIFSCYSSGQQPVQIYMLQKAPEAPKYDLILDEVEHNPAEPQIVLSSVGVTLTGKFPLEEKDNITVKVEPAEGVVIDEFTDDEKAAFDGLDGWFDGTNFDHEFTDGENLLLHIPSSGLFKVTLTHTDGTTTSANIAIAPAFNEENVKVEAVAEKEGTYKLTLPGLFKNVRYKWTPAAAPAVAARGAQYAQAEEEPYQLEEGDNWKVLPSEFKYDKDGTLHIQVTKNGLTTERSLELKAAVAAETVAVPVLKVNGEVVNPAEQDTVEGESTIEFEAPEGTEVYYTLEADGQETQTDVLYTEPFKVSKTCMITYYAKKGDVKSEDAMIMIDIETAVEAIGAEMEEGVYYDLNGRQVKGNLENGIYIVRKGSNAYKVVVK